MIDKFVNFLKNNRKERVIKLFFDIETLQYNEERGRDKPTQYKNVTYSLAVAYFNDYKNSEDLSVVRFVDFYDFLELITETYLKWKSSPAIELIAHNNNKYDNHFLRQDLLYYYPMMTIKNFYLKQGNDDTNELAYKLSQLTKEEKNKGVILEKRVKSKVNLDLIFFLKGVKFFTTDNWIKTNVSLATLGKKLLRINALTEKDLKTDFDYKKYNLEYDLSDKAIREYAKEVNANLTHSELTYIKNDVIILANSWKYYSVIFKGFDYSKMTFTSNILESYNTNSLTSYQLLNKVDKNHLKYTDYTFSGENFYDYLKPFYRGGLNFYNYRFINKVINERVVTIDINSSYPYAMHNFKIPTYLKEYKDFERETQIEINDSNDYYFLYRMTKKSFDDLIISKIQSLVLKEMFVKYYTTLSEYVNINSFTLKTIESVTGLTFNNLKVLSYLKYETVYFGSRKQIEQYYFIKTQGKNKNKIVFNSPYDIHITKEKNDKQLTKEEVDNSKVNLNGLYGIPALRPYFNVFRKINDDYINFHNGLKNNERNIIFSIFVTSVALWNLLSPLSYLTQREIDENFLYCDTDSLYLKYKVFDKIPKNFFNDYHLGKWSIDNDNIEKFKMINHKKYAYLSNNKIYVKSAGVPNNAFNLNVTFEEFCNNQFKEGSFIKNLSSIYNEQGTISIYESTTELKKAYPYQQKMEDETREQDLEEMFTSIRKSKVVDTMEDALYIESIYGVFSMSDVYPVTHKKTSNDLDFLMIKQQFLRELIEND